VYDIDQGCHTEGVTRGVELECVSDDEPTGILVTRVHRAVTALRKADTVGVDGLCFDGLIEEECCCEDTEQGCEEGNADYGSAWAFHTCSFRLVLSFTEWASLVLHVFGVPRDHTAA